MSSYFQYIFTKMCTYNTVTLKIIRTPYSFRVFHRKRAKKKINIHICSERQQEHCEKHRRKRLKRVYCVIVNSSDFIVVDDE